MSTTATIRMYNQNDLGDCFLLQFNNGEQNSWVMIDFGSYQGKDKKQEKIIAIDIKKKLNGEPVNMVLTHQHKDHLSGFINAQDILKDLEIPQLWLSFLDDPNSEKGNTVKDLSTKYWSKNKEVNKLVAKKFETNLQVQKMLKAKKSLDLYAEGQTGGDAIKNLSTWAKETKFLTPGDIFDLPGLNGAVKVYVLGPPTDFNMLKTMNPKAGEDVDGIATLNEIDTLSNFFLNSLDAIENKDIKINMCDGFPFLNKYSIPWDKSNNKLPNEVEILNFEEFERLNYPQKIYNNIEQEWRKIDCDWLGNVGQLALQMDTLTNNTSLVLAFEIVETGKVLLFVGDAQIGNWKSWFDVKFKDSKVTAQDLLNRTVLYKAGHHSSHNATFKKGLDLMNEKELVIMIPLNQQISDAHHFLMGKPEMLHGYNRKAQGRVVRTDTIFQDPNNLKDLKFPFASKPSDIKGLKIEPDNSIHPQKPQLYIEYVVK